MDLQQGIRKRLRDDATVAGLVADRIDWGQRPQGSSLPAVVLQIVNDSRPANLKDYQRVRSTIVQVDVYAKTYNAALSIARAITSVLKNPGVVSDKTFGPSFLENQRDTVETLGIDNVHRQSMDFSVWHKGD